MELYLYERKTIENRSWFLAKMQLGSISLDCKYVNNVTVLIHLHWNYFK